MGAAVADRASALRYLTVSVSSTMRLWISSRIMAGPGASAPGVPEGARETGTGYKRGAIAGATGPRRVTDSPLAAHRSMPRPSHPLFRPLTHFLLTRLISFQNVYDLKRVFLNNKFDCFYDFNKK